MALSFPVSTIKSSRGAFPVTSMVSMTATQNATFATAGTTRHFAPTLVTGLEFHLDAAEASIAVLLNSTPLHSSSAVPTGTTIRFSRDGTLLTRDRRGISEAHPFLLACFERQLSHRESREGAGFHEESEPWVSKEARPTREGGRGGAGSGMNGSAAHGGNGTSGSSRPNLRSPQSKALNPNGKVGTGAADMGKSSSGPNSPTDVGSSGFEEGEWYPPISDCLPLPKHVHRALADLRRAVAAKAQMLTYDGEIGPAFLKWASFLLLQLRNKRLYEIIVCVVQLLLPYEFSDANTRCITYTNILSGLLPAAECETAAAVAEVWGQTLDLYGVNANHLEMIAETTFIRCLEWLDTDATLEKRQSALFMLRKVAEHAPSLCQSHMNEIMSAMQLVMRDISPTIRELAIQVMRSLLPIFVKVGPVGFKSLDLVVDSACQALSSKANPFEDTVAGHAAVLWIELFLCYEKSERRRMEIEPRYLAPWLPQISKYREICNAALQLKIAHPPFLRPALLTLIPILADNKPGDFTNNFLADAFRVLIAFSRGITTVPDRTACILAIGCLIASVGLEPIWTSFGEQLMPIIGMMLNPKPARIDAAATCLALIAETCPDTLLETVRQHIVGLLDVLFATSVSPELAQGVDRIVRRFPRLLPSFQHRLLDMVLDTLAGHGDEGSAQATASNSSFSAATNSSFFIESGPREANGEGGTVEEKLDAFRVLSLFDLSGQRLGSYYANICLPYLTSSHDSLRMASAQLARKMLLTDCGACLATRHHKGSTHRAILSTVVRALLSVAVTDSSAAIRKEALMALSHHEFDDTLCAGANLATLFSAINDEALENVLLAVSIVERLIPKNPSIALPNIRTLLLRLLTKLQNTKEFDVATLSMLHFVARAAPDSMPLYLPAVLDILERVLSPGNPATPAPLAARGEALALVAHLSESLELESEVSSGGQAVGAILPPNSVLDSAFNAQTQDLSATIGGAGLNQESLCSLDIPTEFDILWRRFVRLAINELNLEEPFTIGKSLDVLQNLLQACPSMVMRRRDDLPQLGRVLLSLLGATRSSKERSTSIRAMKLLGLLHSLSSGYTGRLSHSQAPTHHHHPLLGTLDDASYEFDDQDGDIVGLDRCRHDVMRVLLSELHNTDLPMESLVNCLEVAVSLLTHIPISSYSRRRYYIAMLTSNATALLGVAPRARERIFASFAALVPHVNRAELIELLNAVCTYWQIPDVATPVVISWIANVVLKTSEFSVFHPILRDFSTQIGACCSWSLQTYVEHDEAKVANERVVQVIDLIVACNPSHLVLTEVFPTLLQCFGSATTPLPLRTRIAYSLTRAVLQCESIAVFVARSVECAVEALDPLPNAADGVPETVISVVPQTQSMRQGVSGSTSRRLGAGQQQPTPDSKPNSTVLSTRRPPPLETLIEVAPTPGGFHQQQATGGGGGTRPTTGILSLLIPSLADAVEAAFHHCEVFQVEAIGYIVACFSRFPAMVHPFMTGLYAKVLRLFHSNPEAAYASLDTRLFPIIEVIRSTEPPVVESKVLLSVLKCQDAALPLMSLPILITSTSGPEGDGEISLGLSEPGGGRNDDSSPLNRPIAVTPPSSPKRRIDSAGGITPISFRENSGILSFSSVPDRWSAVLRSWTTVPEEEDSWHSWLDKVASDFIKESPIAALRKSSLLIHTHVEILRRLFPLAFASCCFIMELSALDVVLGQFEKLLDSVGHIPAEVLMVLVQSADAARVYTPLPAILFQEKLPHNVVFQLAVAAHSIPLAVHYRESEVAVLAQQMELDRENGEDDQGGFFKFSSSLFGPDKRGSNLTGQIVLSSESLSQQSLTRARGQSVHEAEEALLNNAETEPLDRDTLIPPGAAQTDEATHVLLSLRRRYHDALWMRNEQNALLLPPYRDWIHADAPPETLMGIGRCYEAYQRFEAQQRTVRSAAGMLRCLNRTYAFRGTLKLYDQLPQHIKEDAQIAEQVSLAALILRQWDVLETSAGTEPSVPQTMMHYLAGSIYKKEYPEAIRIIETMRARMEREGYILNCDNPRQKHKFNLFLRQLSEMELGIEMSQRHGSALKMNLYPLPEETDPVNQLRTIAFRALFVPLSQQENSLRRVGYECGLAGHGFRFIESLYECITPAAKTPAIPGAYRLHPSNTLTGYFDGLHALRVELTLYFASSPTIIENLFAEVEEQLTGIEAEHGGSLNSDPEVSRVYTRYLLLKVRAAQRWMKLLDGLGNGGRPPPAHIAITDQKQLSSCAIQALEVALDLAPEDSSILATFASAIVTHMHLFYPSPTESHTSSPKKSKRRSKKRDPAMDSMQEDINQTDTPPPADRSSSKNDGDSFGAEPSAARGEAMDQTIDGNGDSLNRGTNKTVEDFALIVLHSIKRYFDLEIGRILAEDTHIPSSQQQQGASTGSVAGSGESSTMRRSSSAFINSPSPGGVGAVGQTSPRSSPPPPPAVSPVTPPIKAASIGQKPHIVNFRKPHDNHFIPSKHLRDKQLSVLWLHCCNYIADPSVGDVVLSQMLPHLASWAQIAPLLFSEAFDNSGLNGLAEKAVTKVLLDLVAAPKYLPLCHRIMVTMASRQRTPLLTSVLQAVGDAEIPSAKWVMECLSSIRRFVFESNDADLRFPPEKAIHFLNQIDEYGSGSSGVIRIERLHFDEFSRSLPGSGVPSTVGSPTTTVALRSSSEAYGGMPTAPSFGTPTVCNGTAPQAFPIVRTHSSSNLPHQLHKKPTEEELMGQLSVSLRLLAKDGTYTVVTAQELGRYQRRTTPMILCSFITEMLSMAISRATERIVVPGTFAVGPDLVAHERVVAGANRTLADICGQRVELQSLRLFESQYDNCKEDMDERLFVLNACWKSTVHAKALSALADGFQHSASSAAQWLEIRSYYVKQTAQWSLIHYLLDTVNRGADHLRINTRRGIVVHSDMNDNSCFSTAKLQPTPFRLTRALTNAMELSSPFGSFHGKLTTYAVKVWSQHQEALRDMVCHGFSHAELDDLATPNATSFKSLQRKLSKELYLKQKVPIHVQGFPEFLGGGFDSPSVGSVSSATRSTPKALRDGGGGGDLQQSVSGATILSDAAGTSISFKNERVFGVGPGETTGSSIESDRDELFGALMEDLADGKRDRIVAVQRIARRWLAARQERRAIIASLPPARRRQQELSMRLRHLQSHQLTIQSMVSALIKDAMDPTNLCFYERQWAPQW